jgi:hypothetical protein
VGNGNVTPVRPELALEVNISGATAAASSATG